MKDKEILMYIMQANFGCTKKQGKFLLKQMTQEKKDMLLQNFYDNAKKSFYED